MAPIALDPEGIEWAAWTPSKLAARLGAACPPWYIAGGCALELWHSDCARPHEDLEFCVLRADVPVFRTLLSEFSLFTAHAGVLTPLPEGAAVPEEVFQLWALDPVAGTWAFDMMIEPGDGARWVYKRAPGFSAPREAVVRRNARGIPFLAPEVVLLFKAKHLRAKDALDFERAVPRLDVEARDWLRAALERFHPGHAWIELL